MDSKIMGRKLGMLGAIDEKAMRQIFTIRLKPTVDTGSRHLLFPIAINDNRKRQMIDHRTLHQVSQATTHSGYRVEAFAISHNHQGL